MDTCTVETGLLKKKPCGEKAITKCANCEQSLCNKHALARMSGGKKTFLCPECAKAWKQQEKTMGDLPPTPASAPQAAKKPADKPAAPAAKPAAPPKPAAVAPAAKAKEAPKEEQKHDDDAPLEFTPSKKPDEKK